MNIELTRKALEKVGNPHVLVNLVSRRVRQISSGGGGSSRPLVDAPPTMDLADIGLLEIIEEKIGWESTYVHPEHQEVVVPKKKRAPRKAAAQAANSSETGSTPAAPAFTASPEVATDVTSAHGEGSSVPATPAAQAVEAPAVAA